ncbi:sensor histidine kinase [Ramlibacter humi]|uniref:histidine kinase n=1 Tax=Ramlibacter humi TaxID=2530451 RepID=A0A4Z0BLA6_9BURK|nr:HAMP domain-containing sensor histidine kinase [Ramlibacter humi]TFZ00113.1 HAMP domain-containing histidine kinase [Ramlibacter humi]
MQTGHHVAHTGAREPVRGIASRESPSWATRVIAMPLSFSGELGVAIACAAVAIGIRFLLDPWLAQQHVYTIAFAATAVAALVAGWRAGVVCALLAQLSSNVLFVEPRGTFSTSPEDAAQAATFYLMALVLLLVTNVAVRAHRALGSLVLRLRHADEAKTELLATIAHELRNPVSAMQLAADRVEMDDRPEVREKAVAVINRQLAHVTRLVEDLTDASRIHNGKMSLFTAPHRVSELLNRASELVEPSLQRRRQRLVLECADQVVKVDSARIVQVFANVLHNASKYSPDGTGIRVTVETLGKQVCIKVIDEGVGIPNEKLEWVFDCYAQVKTGGDGLGLGLSLVRRLLELHGGTIKALSRGAGEGATFEVSLPLAPPE